VAETVEVSIAERTKIMRRDSALTKAVVGNFILVFCFEEKV
jgi:hypothetical protein